VSAACRFCGCTEADPCRLETNEACLLNVQTLVCNRPKCIVAHEQSQRRDRRLTAAEIARIVAPIAERFFARQRSKREARKSRLRKQRRAA